MNNKQFEMIPMEVNTCAEVSVKKSPVLKLLKYALVGLIAFIALVILFTVGASEINPAVESLAQKLGINEQITVAETSPVAYAWSNPSSNSTTDNTRVATTSKFTMRNESSANTLRPTTAHSGWNWGYYVESGSGHTLGGDGGLSCNGNVKFVVQTLFYVDIYVDDFARAAIANGQITTCNVKLHVEQAGSGNVFDQGTVYGTFFLCASESGSASPALNDMGTNKWVASADKFDDDNQGGRHNYDSPLMTLTLSSTMKKIRFGLYYRTVKDSDWGSAEVFAPCPSISSNFTTDTYKNGKIKFLQSGGDTNCKIIPATSGTYGNSQNLHNWSGTAGFEAGKLYNGTLIGNVTVEVSPGYFFAGWKISSGGLSSNPSKTVKTLNIIGGPYLKASVETVITAYFEKINVFDVGTDFNYKQKLNDEGKLDLSDLTNMGIQQGPSYSLNGAISSENGNTYFSFSYTGTATKYIVVGGEYNGDNEPSCSSYHKIYNSSDDGDYNENVQPSEAGQYRMILGVFVAGSETNSGNLMGYYVSPTFNINKLDITNKTGHTVTVVNDIPSREYSGYAYKPVPSYIDIFVTDQTLGYTERPFRMYTGQFGDLAYSGNVNVDHNVEKGASLNFNGKDNFSGNNTAKFAITHLDVSEFTYEPVMANEIMNNYGVTYTGFEQRPDVILIRITGEVFKESASATTDKTDPGNLTQRTFYVYAQTSTNQNYYNDVLTTTMVGGVSTYVDLYTNQPYKALDRSGNKSVDHNYFTIKNKESAPKEAYHNNWNVCTSYVNGALVEKPAYFEVVFSDKTGNMTGEMKAYFDIAPFDISKVDENRLTYYAQNKKETYTSNAITPIPNVVFVTVSGVNVYVFSGSDYVLQALPITYGFARKNAGDGGEDLKFEDYAPLAVDELGNRIFTGLGESSQFEDWNAYFTGEGTSDFNYDSNVNVAYNGSKPLANVTITMQTSGNVTGQTKTLFHITPRSLSEKPEGTDASNTVGKIVWSDETLYVTFGGYTAQQVGGNKVNKVETYPDVIAYPKGNNESVDLYEGVDFEYEFENANNSYVTPYAVVKIVGKGNYKDSITDNFYIISKEIEEEVIWNLEDQYYTGSKLTPQPETLTITINKGTPEEYTDTLYLGKDYVILGENDMVGADDDPAYGINLGVTDVASNYITISLTGSRKGSGTEGLANVLSSEGTVYGYHNYSGEKLKVYFKIVSRDININAIKKSASWLNCIDENTGVSVATYYGGSLNGDKLSTDYIVVRDEGLEQVTTLELDNDYIVSEWGENINAGIKVGWLKIEGIGNYTGEAIIYFDIYARPMVLGEIDNSTQFEISLVAEKDEEGNNKLGYSYTGTQITPDVDSIEDSFLDVSLTEGVDFTVSYGNTTKDGVTQNIDVLAGGKVIILGCNNYSGSLEVEFEITPIDQVAFVEDPKDNSNLSLESKANKIEYKNLVKAGNTKVMYADYEWDPTTGSISIVAYTTATASPLRRVDLKVVNIEGGGATNIVQVVYDSVELATVNGKEYAKTTARLTHAGAYGIIRVYAEQYDNTIDGTKTLKNGMVGGVDYYNRGNYNNYSFTYGSNDPIYSIYVKKHDQKAESFKLNQEFTYGNDDFELNPGLTSSALGNLIVYSAEAVNDDGYQNVVVELTGGASAVWNASIKNAGKATITVSHGGYAPQNYVQVGDDANAFVAFTMEVKLVVKPRSLTISFEPLTIPYGVDPSSEGLFKYTYSTNAIGDDYKGLSYNHYNRADNPDDILKGYTVNYHDDYRKVNELGYTLSVLPEAIIERGPLYDNYEVGYAPSTLYVTKKTLNVSATNCTNANVILKDYGQPVPSPVYGGVGEGYTVTYMGYAYDEGYNTLINAGFTECVVDFSGPTIDGKTYPKIDETTPVGSYYVPLMGGLSTNYEFAFTEVKVTISPVQAQISLGYYDENGEFVAIRNGDTLISTEYNAKEVTIDATLNVLVDGLASRDGFEFTKPNVPSDGLDIGYEGALGAGNPITPGSYDVIITVTPENGDNYYQTEIVFSNAIVIDKTAPIISIGNIKTDYTGSPVDLTDKLAQIVPVKIENGVEVSDGYTLSYYYATDAESGYEPTLDANGRVTSYDTSKYSYLTPIENGKYDLIVIFTPYSQDRYYKTVTYWYKDKIEVSAGTPDIVPNRDIANGVSYVYDGRSHGFTEDDFDVVYKGVSHKDEGTLLIEYSIDSDSWTTDQPKDSGRYSVRVTFTPYEGASVSDQNTNFSILTIEKFDLTTPGYISAKLNGIVDGWREVTYDAKGHPLDDSEIFIQVVPADRETSRRPLGSISIEYLNVDTNETFKNPTNAGTYKALVTYITGGDADNYYMPTNATAVDVGVVLVIKQAEIIIVTEIDNKVEPYTGNGVMIEEDIDHCHGIEISAGLFDTNHTGKLVYAYRKSGQGDYDENLVPTDVGEYDLQIRYQSGKNDNYYNLQPVEFIGIIKIEHVLPSITIKNMEFDYGERIAPYYEFRFETGDKPNTSVAIAPPGYDIRGAQADTAGPVALLIPDQYGIATAEIIVEYGKRFTNAQTGKFEFEWSLNAPVESGTYSVKVSYNVIDLAYSNYANNSVTKQDCLTILNIKPHFQLDKKVASYDGTRIGANMARIYDSASYDVEYVKWQPGMDGLDCYYGTLAYEYRKQGTSEWSTLAPQDVGTYDVRIQYQAAKVDSFKSDALIVNGALVINPLEIKVMPLYGQGHVYNGGYSDGSSVAFVYSYVKDGYKYVVYSTVGDLDRKEVIDISSAEYVAENGHVYTIVTDTATSLNAWRDYYTKELTYLSGSFTDGDEVVVFKFEDLSDTEGKVQYTTTDGKTYVIDLDREVVYLDNASSYNLGIQSGCYFSIVDGTGAVNVIEIIPSKIVDGYFIAGTTGNTKRYQVNLTTMKATDPNGTVYDIYTSVGFIADENGNKVLIDHASYYEVGMDGIALYKHANGQAYLIDINTSKVEKVAVLNVDTVSFTYYGYEGEEKVVELSVSDIKALYSSNAYVGEYTDGDITVIVDVKSRSVRIPTFFKLRKDGETYIFKDAMGFDEAFTWEQLIMPQDEYLPEGHYYYYSYGGTYYVDVNNMIVKDINNLFTYDVTNNVIYQEVGGEREEISADSREFVYKVTVAGKLHSTTTLYGRDYEVEAGKLIGNNKWSGSLRLHAPSAGQFVIGLGTLGIEGANYKLNTSDTFSIVYNVDRAMLQITFNGNDGAIYDGENKKIGYEITGFVNGENENAITVKQEYAGDTMNVTESGYYTKITIVTQNYYLEGGDVTSNNQFASSERFHILPAQMAPVVFERGDDVTYDGLKHYLELKEVERGAKVTYGGSSTAPYFVEPGIYTITALVSKDNYVSQEVELTLVIKKAKYNVNAQKFSGTMTYGDALPDIMCDSKDGSIALDPGQILLPGVTTYTWTFTPYSQDFYKFYEGNSNDGSTITGTIEINVNKAQANIVITGELVQSATNPSAIVGVANGLSHNESDLVTIVYIGADGTRYSTMPTDAGKYTVEVTYAGDEYHAETVYSAILTIEEESHYEWIIILGSVLLVLTVLSTVFFLIRRTKKLD